MSYSSNLYFLHDQVAVLTGGAGFLGREYASALAQAGAHVVIADIDGGAASEVALEVTKQYGIEAKGFATDVTSKPSVDAMVEQTLASFGHVDILINNAAIDPKFDSEHAGENIYNFEEYPLDLWNECLAVNLTGMFVCAQAVARPMQAQNKGVIVNISSIYGMVGPDQRLYEKSNEVARSYKPVVYSVTKSAVLGLTRYLATYWAGRNIRVNTLTLGGVFNNHDEEFLERYSYRTPLGRMAQRSEYCGALVFLVSDASSYMTGANLVIDGGWTAW